MGKTAIVIVAAGHGTISPGLSKLVEVVDDARTPMIVRVVRIALAVAGCPVIIVINTRFREQILGALDRADLLSSIQISIQEERRGAANAVFCALPLVKQNGCNSLLTLYGDMPLWRSGTLKNLIGYHCDRKAMISMVSVSIVDARTPECLTQFGRILRDNDGRIVGVVEPGDATTLQIAATSTVNPSLFVIDCEWFEKNYPRIPPYHTADGYEDEYHLPPLVAFVSQDGLAISEMMLGDPNEALGVNNAAELEAARQILRARNGA